MSLALSLVVQSVNAKVMKSPFYSCISEASGLDIKDKNVQENLHLFQGELAKASQGQPFNADTLCQYNPDKENCKQCVLTQFQRIKWQNTKENIFISTKFVLMFVIISGFFYLLFRIIRKKEMNHKLLKIFFIIIGTIILLLILIVIFTLLEPHFGIYGSNIMQ